MLFTELLRLFNHPGQEIASCVDLPNENTVTVRRGKKGGNSVNLAEFFVHIFMDVAVISLRFPPLSELLQS